MKRDNPELCVHLRVESAAASADAAAPAAEIVMQPEAPVVSIVYRTPKTRVSALEWGGEALRGGGGVKLMLNKTDKR